MYFEMSSADLRFHKRLPHSADNVPVSVRFIKESYNNIIIEKAYNFQLYQSSGIVSTTILYFLSKEGIVTGRLPFASPCPKQAQRAAGRFGI